MYIGQLSRGNVILPPKSNNCIHSYIYICTYKYILTKSTLQCFGKLHAYICRTL